MPVSADEVTAVERAVTEFERAAEELVRARGDVADLSEDLKGRRARIDRLSGENDEAAEVLGEKQTAYLADEEELRVLGAGQRSRVRADQRRDIRDRGCTARGESGAENRWR